MLTSDSLIVHCLVKLLANEAFFAAKKLRKLNFSLIKTREMKLAYLLLQALHFTCPHLCKW